MLLPAHATAAFADFLADYLSGCLDDDNCLREEAEMDPNDFIILHDFVLPDLQEARDTGIDTSELLDKGWMLAAGLLPVLLAGDTLKGATYGVLARAMQLYFLEHAINYIGCLEDDWYKENVERINQYIGFAQLPLPRHKKT